MMVIGAARCIESQTRELFEPCRLRDIPIVTNFASIRLGPSCGNRSRVCGRAGGVARRCADTMLDADAKAKAKAKAQNDRVNRNVPLAKIFGPISSLDFPPVGHSRHAGEWHQQSSMTGRSVTGR